MAKLRHLQNMLQRIGQVDEARARVLVMKARAAGHFTTGGRGNSAPEMGPRDATSTLLLALHLDNVTDAAEGIQALRDLPFLLVKHNFDDDWSRDLEADWVGPDGEGLSEHLPSALEGKVPATLGEALDALFSKPEAFENRWDMIEHSKRWGLDTVALSLSDTDYRRDGYNGQGQRTWEFLFELPAIDGDKLGAWTTKTVHGDALRALRDLIAGEGAD